MASHYRRFLKLLEDWPVDVSKKGRDLGEHLRDQVKSAFSAGEVSRIDEAKCEKIYMSLKKLANNHYGNLYKRTSSFSAMGMTSEQCGSVVSTEFLKSLEKEEMGFFKRIFQRD